MVASRSWLFLELCPPTPPPLRPRWLPEAGGKIIAVSSSETATFNEDGLDIPALRAHAADQVSLIKDFPGGTRASSSEAGKAEGEGQSGGK
eukprot:224290-Chlamydomonas_euryale.AAC.1